MTQIINNLQEYIDSKFGKMTEEEHPLFGTLLVNEEGEAISHNSDVIGLLEAVRILKKLENKA